MKRFLRNILSMALIMAMLFGNMDMVTYASGQGQEIYLYGDTDQDGDITVSDALAVLKHVVGLQTILSDDPVLFRLYDPTRDGTIGTGDALWILKAVVKLIKPGKFSIALDSDSDGIFDADELALGSDPYSPDDAKKDSDGDGLEDYLEIYVHKTDINNADTDYDGLSDLEEVNLTGTDPFNADTDSDGINDYYSDEDLDGVCNWEELIGGLDPLSADTDGDGLTDYDELYSSFTDPLKMDTDEDGADDNWEIQQGYDSVSYNASFVVTAAASSPESGNGADVVLECSGDPSTVLVTEVADETIFGSKIPGCVGSAYDFSSEADFETATITFTYDPEAVPSDADLQIYYFDEELQLLEPVDTTVSYGTATAVVTHFSTYVLLDRKLMEEVWDTEIFTKDSEKYNDSIFNIAFVIDYSASMDENDPDNLRLKIVDEFIKKLREDQDRASIIKFAAYATNLVPLTTDKLMLSNAVNGITNASSDGCSDSEAGTNGSDGIYTALEELKGAEGDYRYIIFLTDGEDTVSSYEYKDLIDDAAENNIIIYSIGMGNADKELLTNIAESTGGKFYSASTVDMEDTSEGSLMDAFEDIQTSTIDIETDSNRDGISDYYTRLLCQGKLCTGTGVALFEGVSYDAVQADLDGDYDNDGIKNGDEAVVRHDKDTGKTYLYVISSPVSQDTDRDGIPDDIDTAPRDRGLAGGIIGALKICSYGDKTSSSGGFSGHAYVAYTSFIDDELKLYGILVDSYANCAKKGDSRSDLPEYHNVQILHNEVISIGGWAQWLPDQLKGTWINNEYMSFYQDSDTEHGVLPDQRSLTAYLTEADVKRMEKFTKTNSKWSVFYNCSAYAADLWNAATGDNLSAAGLWCSPSSLNYNMEQRGDCQIGEEMAADLP